MKKITLLILLVTSSTLLAQFTTDVVNLAGSTRTLKIDTNATTVTMTLTGSSTAWLGVGFGGSAMASVSDMFIWNATTNRDYTPSGGYSTPAADAAGSQNWTIITDSVTGTTRTVVATRALSSLGDYTFLNNNSSIPIIFAEGSTTTLAYHSANPHAAQTLTRTALGVDDFSLNASVVYPNPSNGNFKVTTKTAINEIAIYSQSGAFIKLIKVDSTTATEVNVAGLQTGIYLLELKNDTEKSWKKVVIE